jgi:succinate dehydrogenase / fumarate reductase cytochrome b subunit
MSGFEHGQVYANVYSGFQNAMTAGFYIVAMALLALHLYHGTWSMFQTLGVDTPKWNTGIRFAAKAVAVLLFVGFAAAPLSVVAGVLPAPVATPVTPHGSH